MHRAASTSHEYTTQSHYPDIGPTSPGVTMYMFNAERLARKQLHFGLTQPVHEPATFRLQGKRFIHLANPPV